MQMDEESTYDLQRAELLDQHIKQQMDDLAATATTSPTTATTTTGTTQ